MKKLLFYLIFITCILLVLVVKQMQEKPAVHTFIPFWDQENAIASLKKNIDKIDAISVFWFRIDGNAKLQKYQSSYVDEDLIAYAQKRNVKVFALVANLQDSEGNAWDGQAVEQAIGTRDARRIHITDLIKLTEDFKFDGITIDYESLPPTQRNNFSAFIEELSYELHEKNKLLGVALHPKNSGSTMIQGASAQDEKRIARTADILHIMTYTNYNNSKPSPTNSITWIRTVMNHTLHTLNLPRKKIYLGIGLIGTQWSQQADGSYYISYDDLTYESIKYIMNRYNPQIMWDDKTKTAYFEYYTGPQKHIIGFDNKRTVQERVSLAQSLRVGGVSYWRLGGEDNAIWEM